VINIRSPKRNKVIVDLAGSDRSARAKAVLPSIMLYLDSFMKWSDVPKIATSLAF
jgi:hypothetical protein